MQAPWYSTVTLLTEVLVTIGVLTVFYQGYYKNKFPKALAAVVVSYEILFNISYMAYRSVSHLAGEAANAVEVETPFLTGLAIVHGILSLVMFLALVIFLYAAWRHYALGQNYFKHRKAWTIVFIVFWLFSVISGVVFYFALYVFS